MTLGLAGRQGDLLDGLTRFCDQALPEASVYGLLHRERDRLFPDEAFADLFTEIGRRSVPPCIVATVMVLQRLEGCSDRERPTGSPSTPGGVMPAGWGLGTGPGRVCAYRAGGLPGPPGPLGAPQAGV